MTTDVGSFEASQADEGGPTPVSSRVSPTDRLRAEIDALFTGERDLVEVLEDVAVLAPGCSSRAPWRPRWPRSSAVPATSVSPPLPRPSRDTAMALPDHGEDHDRAGDGAPAKAARHQR